MGAGWDWPLADRIVLQMDQATSADQSLLRHESQRRAHAGLERPRRLSARRHLEKAASSHIQPRHHPTDFEPHPFRKNAHSTGYCSTHPHSSISTRSEPPVFIKVLNRTVVTSGRSFLLLLRLVLSYLVPSCDWFSTTNEASKHVLSENKQCSARPSSEGIHSW